MNKFEGQFEHLQPLDKKVLVLLQQKKLSKDHIGLSKRNIFRKQSTCALKSIWTLSNPLPASLFPSTSPIPARSVT